MEQKGQGSKKSLHIATLQQKLQDDVNLILTDLADYLLAEDDEYSTAETKFHLDVDMVLSNMHIPKMVMRRSKRVLRSHAHASLIPKANSTEPTRPMPHYNPEFFKSNSTGNEKRPFGKLNSAARLVFKNI
jgi:hypothetical protein